MLQRLYTHNFRCFENFEFKPSNNTSALLIGKNGSGKSTLMQVFRFFQSIGRGEIKLGNLVKTSDFTLGRDQVPMRFELEAKLANHIYNYVLVLELPEGFRELRVKEEQLLYDSNVVFSREQALVTIPRTGKQKNESQFSLDWHTVALPIIQNPTTQDAISIFRGWLSGMVLLSPIPSQMTGDANRESLSPSGDGSNFADWVSGLLAQYPAAYATLSEYLTQIMPDLADFRFERTGKESKSLLVRFSSGDSTFELPFDVLSDGEKCFFLSALLLAANKCYGPLFAFWDEPDNYLSLNEVSHFITALRRGFHSGGHIFMTSHNEEAIRRFAHENTWVLGRKSHLEPSIIRRLDELPESPDVVHSLICGELEPWA